MTSEEDEPSANRHLLRMLERHMTAVRAAARANEFVDLVQAQKLHAELVEAIAGYGRLDPERWQVLADAVTYFVRTDDDEDDLRSPIGFDDDAAVVEAALRKLRG